MVYKVAKKKGPKWCGPDIICVVTGSPGADIHHLYTRKARPDLIDRVWNMIPIAHSVHVEWHKRGTRRMADEYFAVKHWMINHGWAFDEYSRKWLHPAAVGEDQ